MSNHGWRIPSKGLARAEQYARDGQRLNVPKSQAITAVKKVSTSLGLRPPEMLLLDTLAAITQPQDWERGRRPVVWPSNTWLMEQCGCSLTALKRHLRNLSQIGIVSFKDSPNGKRWGYRNDEGHIVEAFGIDLGPLAARCGEFEALHAQEVEEKALCKSLRNSITVSRRMIYARIEKAVENGLKGPWEALGLEFAGLLQRLPGPFECAEKLLDIAEWFKVFAQKVEEAFAAAFDWPAASDAQNTAEGTVSNSREEEGVSSTAPSGVVQEAVETSVETGGESRKLGVSGTDLSPMGFTGEPHIQSTNHPYPVNSNSAMKSANLADQTKSQPSRVRQIPQQGGGTSAKTEAGARDIEVAAGIEAQTAIDAEHSDWNTIQWGMGDNPSTQVELTTVMAACPEFAEMARQFAGGYVKTWQDLHRAAHQIRPMAGVSQDAWDIAQKTLGPFVAAATMGLIYEKYASGEVNQPGGYLRGILAKNIEGKLNLHKSFYGRIKRMTPSNTAPNTGPGITSGTLPAVPQ